MSQSGSLASVEEREHGQDSAVHLLSLRQPQLHENATHMLFHGSLCYPEPAGDPAVGTTLRHEREHLTLTGREDVEWIIGALSRDKLLNKRRIHDRTASDDPLERLDEVGDVRDTPLQQVSDALPAGEQVHCMLDLDVCGKNQNRRLREPLANHPCRVKALRRVSRWHADVDHGQVRPVLLYQRDELRRVPALSDDLETRTLEQARQTLTEEHVILRQQYPSRAGGHVDDYRLSPPAGYLLPAMRPTGRVDDPTGVALRCLIVDDNASFLAAATSLLEKEGMTVVGVASTIADALRHTRELHPDVVLADVTLRHESGFDLARRLAETDPGPTAILISTHAEADFADLIETAPVAGFISKSELSATAIKRLAGA